jgi:hypothetical protein
MPVFPSPQKICHPVLGGLAQVVQHLPSKCEALSSNSSTAKKKKKRTLAELWSCDYKGVLGRVFSDEK